jgi:hypothetical protein
MAWLQVKGDPQIRKFLFAQSRTHSTFDHHIDDLHSLVNELLIRRGVFHARIHYSSNQISIWRYSNPYNYEVYLADEVCCKTFKHNFPISFPYIENKIPHDDVCCILDKFKELRFQDEQVYLRSASIHMVNGMINLGFSCDGSHYMPHEKFVDVSWKFINDS